MKIERSVKRNGVEKRRKIEIDLSDNLRLFIVVEVVALFCLVTVNVFAWVIGENFPLKIYPAVLGIGAFAVVCCVWLLIPFMDWLSKWEK